MDMVSDATFRIFPWAFVDKANCEELVLYNNLIARAGAVGGEENAF